MFIIEYSEAYLYYDMMDVEKMATWYRHAFVSHGAADFELWNVKVKVKLEGQRCNILVKIAHLIYTFSFIQDGNLIFGMHVYLMQMHILSGERSRSRSYFKVDGQIYAS